MGMNTDAVQRLYVAYFNRPADPASLAVYEAMLPSDRVATQAELEAIAETYFSPSQEYLDTYAGMSESQIVNALYQNLFGREAEPAGLLAWTQALIAGTETIASIALQLTYSAQGTDADSIAAKIKAANAFTTEVASSTDNITGYAGNDAAASARAWLATVTTDASADTAIAGVEAAVAAAIAADSTPVDPVATFSLASDVTASNEGTTVYFTLTTENVAAGTQYSYSLSGTNITNGDVDGSLAGTATIDADGKAVIAVDFSNDELTEGTETITLSVAGQTAAVNINDTSLTPTTPSDPVATFSLASDVTASNEGTTVYFTLTTTNVAAGTQYSYTLSGTNITNGDVDGSLAGTATIDAEGKAVIAVDLSNDQLTEGSETITMSVAGETASVGINDTSTTVVPSYTLTASQTPVNEGDTVTFTMVTTGVAEGSQLAWAITGLETGDVVGGGLSGIATVGADGRATVSVAIAGDESTETAQTMTFSMAGESVDVTVNDTSQDAALTFALTTGVDNFTGNTGDDTFSAALSGGNATLGSLDSLNGGIGTDTLTVELGNHQVLPASVVSVETVNINSSNANAQLDFTNFDSSLANVNSSASTANLSLANLGTGVAVTIANTTSATTIDMLDSAVTGTSDAIGVTLTNVTGAADLVFDTALEEVDLTSNTANSVETDFAGTIDLAGSSTLTLSGVGGNDVAAAVVDAADYTGELTIVMTNAAHTVTGGSGDDDITGATGNANTLTGGDGDDDITGGSAADTINAGDGANTIDGNNGNDTITAGSGADDITGGTGNEVITTGDGANTVDSETGTDKITGGSGDDRIIFDTALDLTVADTVDPGTGTDTLVVTAADIDTNEALGDTVDLAALQAGMANFNIIEIDTQVGAGATSADMNIARLATGAMTVNVDVASGAIASTFTLNAGNSTVNLNHTAGNLGGATSFVANGTATDDGLTLKNNNAADTARFGTAALTITGYETVTIDGGDTAGTTTQTTGTIAFTPTTNTASTINLTGENIMSLGVVTQTGTSVLTIDASDVTAQDAGTTTVTIAAPVTTDGTNITGSLGEDVITGDTDDVNTITGNGGDDTMNGGTAADSITGAAGADSITGNNGADTLQGAGGNDEIIGGTGNDSLVGGEGADSITSGGGNDTIAGGAGNDRIILGGDTLTVADTINGGDDTDTLVLAADATIGEALNVSNFEVVEYTAGVTQSLFVFDANNTLSQITLAGDASYTFTNAASTTNTISLSAQITGEDVTFSRVVDGSSDELTVSMVSGAHESDINTLTVSDAETLTLSVAADNTILHIDTALTAADATSLTLTGAGDVKIDAITATANLATLDMSDLTGDAVIAAGNVTADMTVTTGSGATAANRISVTTGTGDDKLTAGAGGVTFVGGSGSDTLTGSDVADQLTGGADADTVTGGGGVDTIAGGGGADSIDAGAGNDEITGGTGADTILGGEGDDTVTGGTGADSIVGGTGADSLNGSEGNDTVTGGAGADHFQLEDKVDGAITIIDFTDGEDRISIANNVTDFGGTTGGTDVVTADYVTAAAITAIGADGSASDNAIVEISAEQTTAQIQLGIGGDAEAVVVVFNSDTGMAEIWFDTAWDDVANRVKLASIPTLDTLAKTTALTFADFYDM